MTEVDTIKALVETNIDDADVMVSGDGRHFKLRIISTVFQDKTTLERQQFVYGILGDKVTQGEIHALTMQTYTPNEWQKHHG